MYAQLCHRLCEDAPNFDPPGTVNQGTGKNKTFRRLLLNKCQDEFENRSRATEAFDGGCASLTEEEMDDYHLAKRKMLGNIKFIGELGKLGMLHEGILHKCIKQLLEKKKNVHPKDLAEDLECLCQIMKTVGRRLDTNKAKAWMDQYFSRMRTFANNPDMPARIRFMLQDVLELRHSVWKPRKMLLENGPRTIMQIREEAAKDHGMMIHPGQMGQGGRGHHMDRNNQTDRMNMYGHSPPSLNGGGMGSRGGGMADVFGSMPPAYMGAGLGTGPGVIPMDSYSSGGGGGYQQGMGGRMGRQNQGYNPGGGQYGGRGGQNRNGNGPQQMQQQQHNRQQQQQQQQRDLGGNRELPPRFMKQKGGPGGGGSEEINLRPARGFTMFKPNSPNMLPKSAQPTAMTPEQLPLHRSQHMMKNSDSMMPNPLLQKVTPIIIKEEKKQKENKPEKKKQPSKEELLKTTENILKEYLGGGDLNEAAEAVRLMRSPKRLLPEILCVMMKHGVDTDDEARDKVYSFIKELKSLNIINKDHYMDGFSQLVSQLSELEVGVPLVKSYVAKFAARAVIDELISLVELSEPLRGGAHYPLFMLCLQQISKLEDKEWLVKAFTDSKIELPTMLPEADRSKERMMQVLEDRGLSFLFPLLRVQADLWKQLQKDPNAASLYRWIKDNVDNQLHQTQTFISILTHCLLKYITSESTMAEDVDTQAIPDKALTEKEKELLEKYKGVFQALIHDKMDLQLETVYTLQVFTYNHNFPKGMLLRMFVNFYDEEIIDEETFSTWKQEVNDEYPGKGKALFQVNQWLTWLEQAESEEDDEDDDEDEDDD